MDKFVDYKEAPFGDKVGWDVENDLVRGGKGNAIGWKIEYEPVWGGEGRLMGWKPKNENVRGKRADVVFVDLEHNYEIKIDEAGYVYIDDNRYNPFESLKPVEKRGLYDLCIDGNIDIPESISKDSPCYKQFMKEKENVE
jgi:hypothetical protein